MSDLRGKVKEKVQDYLGISDSDPETVHASDWIKNRIKDLGPFSRTYVASLFPFLQWAPRYNLTWLFGDLVAGITVGMVLVPQSLSYAKLALLSPEYGLYSSFIGVLTYAFFATAKDVSIGPVAVMSLETGNIVESVMNKYGELYSAPQIAVCLAFICGIIVLAIGLLRIGFIVEFIPQPAVSGFMTGSALNIAAGQVPAVFGLAKRLNTRDATYKVIINTLKNLPHTSLDAAFGLTALTLLYGIKWSLTYVSKRYPRLARPAFFAMCLRHAFTIILFTIISWRLNIHTPDKPRISLVGYVPSGLRHVGQPMITGKLIGAIGPHLPVATIILLLEHISIAKSFGRLNGYKINPNQELIAIGVNNSLGSVFSAYPSTGSFSRSALKAKSGVRTPAAGIPTGVVVIVALYAVAPAFFWIPNAALSALIIHAVADLVTPLRQSIGFWRVSPFEYIIFVGAVLWSIFYSIESGIYWSLASSAALLLFRIARPKGHFLGRVRVHQRPDQNPESGVLRDVYVPLDGSGGMTNRGVRVEPPPPGIVIYRFEESFLYPNASHINDRIIEHVKATTRRGHSRDGMKKGDRPWNDPAPTKAQAAKEEEENRKKPRLRAVILDFAAVANLDTTGVQNLIDTRREVEKWAERPVEFHFTGILSPWIRRALIAGGFGRGKSTTKKTTMIEVAPVVPNVPGNVTPRPDFEPEPGLHPGSPAFTDSGATSPRVSIKDYPASSMTSEGSSDLRKLEEGIASVVGGGDGVGVGGEKGRPRGESQTLRITGVPLLDGSTPFFHFDLAEALDSVGTKSPQPSPVENGA